METRLGRAPAGVLRTLAWSSRRGYRVIQVAAARGGKMQLWDDGRAGPVHGRIAGGAPAPDHKTLAKGPCKNNSHHLHHLGVCRVGHLRCKADRVLIPATYKFVLKAGGRIG